jgi:hypothetical protein
VAVSASRVRRTSRWLSTAVSRSHRRGPLDGVRRRDAGGGQPTTWAATGQRVLEYDGEVWPRDEHDGQGDGQETCVSGQIHCGSLASVWYVHKRH